MRKTNITPLLAMLCIIALSGCASVEPWQRGNLAKPHMQWQADEMQASFDRHVYFSKEAASGGDTTAGGGCGCN